MTVRTVILRSVQYYWRTHLGVILGAALGALVLTGALLVGDSVKATLRRQAEMRVGKADVAMTGGDRFFRAVLADAAGAEAAPVLMLRATVARADGGARVNVAQLLGVDERFWKLAPVSADGDGKGRVGVPPAAPGVPPGASALDRTSFREPAPSTGGVPGVTPGTAGGTPTLPRNVDRSAPAPPMSDAVDLNSRLAQQLRVAPGDTVIVRVEKPGAFSKDAPLSGEENDAVALRVRVARIVSDEEYGRFALAASQVPPFTVFAPLAMVQRKLGTIAKANVLLLANVLPRPVRYMFWDTGLVTRLPRGHFRYEALQKSFSSALEGEPIWSLTDAQLSLRDLSTGGLELRTSRVFLDPPVVAAAPRGKDDRRVDSLTYFVNAIEAGGTDERRTSKPELPMSNDGARERSETGNEARDPIRNPQSEIRNLRSTPYSMVTAVEAPSSGFLPAELADDEIVISQWEADDLGITTGAKVTVKYFTMGERRELVEKAREFNVLAVLPMSEPQLNSSWMPDFPGLSDKKNCRDWKPGFAFDATRMREKDQAYWEQYRGTPKAFVNLKIGQEMWGNRWGNTTALRWPAGTDRAEIEKALREKLTPEMLGFQFIPLREQALAATKAPVDFGELFVSFSFFLIIAAAVLTGLLFVFSLEQRNAEAGLLLALGLRPRQVRRMFLLEGAALAVIGSVLGVAGAALYTKLVLRALTTVWRGAVGAVQFEFVMPPATLAIGVVSGVLVALLAMWLASRRQMRRTARELLVNADSGERGEAIGNAGGRCARLNAKRQTPNAKLQTEDGGEPARFGKLWRLAFGVWRSAFSRAQARPDSIETVAKSETRTPWSAIFLFVCALALAFFGGRSPGVFFGAGALLLLAGLMFVFSLLRRSANAAGGLETLAQLGTRNAARRRGRSLATIAVLASGVFMVVAVDSFRHGPIAETTQKDSGTGGFALVGESATPVYDDLNTAKGREVYGLDDKIMEGVNVVPMRVRDGDDASCLNLNRALQPRLLGVKPGDLAGRFRFSKTGADWPLLSVNNSAEEVAGIVDANTLQWALQKKLGDAIEYRNDGGQTFRVKLVAAVSGSMLQGNILISEEEFVRQFPNQGGYRAFLVDAPTAKADAVRTELSRALQDRGLELTTTAQRLGEFQAVENTYLAIFQVLGGLGMLLGSAGLAIVVARNVLERRSEFGLLEAVGFRPGQLRSLVFAEHRWLIVCGLAIGTVSALVAVWPNLRERANGFPYGPMALLLAGMVVGCVFWAWLATWLALRGRGSAALRSE